jgi:hypothetical protein
MRFDLASLYVNQVLQGQNRRIEGPPQDLLQRIVHVALGTPPLHDYLVVMRHADVYPNPERIPLFLIQLGFFDRHAATYDVAAHMFELGDFLADEFLNLIDPLNTPERDNKRFLHSLTLKVSYAKCCLYKV